MDTLQEWPLHHKNIYRHLSSQNSIQLPQQGSRSILPQANQILQQAWKKQGIGTTYKGFHLEAYSKSTCPAVEDDDHLFFHCNLPRAVWFSFTPPMRTDNLPQENDGIQLTLQSFISNSTSDSLFQKILLTMWYIWKARNDARFQRQTRTPLQVHNAVAAHINTHMNTMVLGDATATTHITGTLQSPAQASQTRQGMLNSLQVWLIMVSHPPR